MLPVPVLIALITAVGTIASAAFGFLSKKFNAEANSAAADAKSKQFAAIMAKVTHCVQLAVGVLSHKVTPDMLAKLASGDPSAKDLVLSEAGDAVMSYLGSSGLEEFAGAMGIPQDDATKMIEAQVEALILAMAEAKKKAA